MPRPTNKEELLKQAGEQYEKMWGLIEELPGNVGFHPDIATQGKEAHWGRDKNVRDVLVHLHEWHKLLLGWVEGNMAGEGRPFLPEPYTWKTYGDMNVGFWKRHQDTSYEAAVELLADTHSKVIDLIEGLSAQELFEKKHFAWTGTTNVGAYCISATSAHYDWAIKKIKAHMKLVK